MKKFLIIVTSIIVAMILLAVGCTALVGGAITEVADEMEADDKAAMSDVTITECGGYDSLDGPLSKVKIVNSSDETQSYYVEVTYYDGEGNTLGTGNASIDNLDADKKWTGKVTSLDSVEGKPDFTCEVTDASRYAA